MKKFATLSIVGLFALSIGGLSAFAQDAKKSPAENYAELAGITVEEAYTLKGTDKTFGELANEIGLLEEFKAANQSTKLIIISELVESGTITQEQADEFILAMDTQDCTELGQNKLGKEFGIGFGKYFKGNEQGQGKGYGSGNGHRHNR